MRILLNHHSFLNTDSHINLAGRYSNFCRMAICLILSVFLIVPNGNSQTDFAPGQIMFTGYDSDDADAFSIVLLTDVVSGTDIYITDRGWSNTSGFRVDNTNEGTIKFSFTEAYTCGTEFIFLKNTSPTPDVWVARDINGNIEGTVSVETGSDANGPVLTTTGDQLFIYQLPVPTSGNQTSFVSMIQMNNDQFGGIDTDEESSLPSGLTADDIVRFVTEVDNAEYNCLTYAGSSTTIQAAITNDNGSGGLLGDINNNWTESNNYLTLNGCDFCCGILIAAPSLSAPSVVATNETFTITITGNLTPGESWQLFTAGCDSGNPVQTTMSSSFTVTAPGTEGIVTYYVNTSEDATCGVLCATLEVGVCSNTTNMNTCTDCFADPQACGNCLLPDPSDNPDLDSGCYAIKLIFILDESGSINTPVNYEPDVRNGVLAFLNAINGQDMQVALIEFSDLGRVVNNYTTVNSSYIQSVQFYLDDIVPLNNQTYQPGGGTNWHDAMLKAEAMDQADIIMFFTDGIPTGWTNNGAVDYCFNGSTTQTPEIVNPVKLANKLKSEDTHMFMLGVGSGIDEENLQLMSGLTEYNPAQNTIGTADYSIGNFEDLADDLESFVDELCETPLELDKQALGVVCDGVQQFMFIIHNPGEESAATVVQVIDTFPSGYNNIVYHGLTQIKICFGPACASQGQPQPENAFIWTTNSLPPGESDTLILSVNVLPTGSRTNIGWAQGTNTGLASDTVTGSSVIDQSPIISCPADVTIECSDSTLPVETGTATGSDPDGITPIFTYADDIIESDCSHEYIIQRLWTATDACNNIATCLQVIAVEDTTAPELECPANVTLQCMSATMPANTGIPVSSDNCDAAPVITYSDVVINGECPEEYTVFRTWQSTDLCGNSSTCIQTILLQDNELPVINCPPDITLQCNESTLPSNTGTAKGSDICDDDPETIYSDQMTGECTISRTWQITDACGNVNSCIQLIVVEDSDPPLIACPANVTIQCNDSTEPSGTGLASTSDTCDPSPVLTYSDNITGAGCPQSFSISRTWTSTDICGNTTTCVQMITVQDISPPALVCPPNIVINCTDSTLPLNTGNPDSSDNCDLAISVTYTDEVISGTCSQDYTIIRTWVATDDCGNSSSCSQSIQVTDDAPPALTCPADLTLDCTANILPPNTGTATSTDNCGSPPVISYSDSIVSGACPHEYMITRTWTSTDACGNTSTCNQFITVDDSLVPDIVCPPDITIECIESTLPDDTGEPLVSDNCDAAPVVTFNDVTMTGPSEGGYTITRTWNVSDACGHSSTCMQIITLTNPAAPAIMDMSFDTICSGESLTFTTEEQSAGNASYQWMFGSGSAPVSGTGSGPHNVAYTHNGINGTTGALVVLSVTLEGCPSISDTVANVHVNALPNATINAPSGPLCYFKVRSFQPLAPQIPGYTYQWNFGPNASVPPISGYGPHQVEYSVADTVTVQLIVSSNASGALCIDTGTLTFIVVACPGNITGRVRRPNGTGIGSATVRLYRDDNLDGLPDGASIRTVSTTANGGYSISGNPPGQYVVGQTDLPNYYSLYDIDESNDFDTIVPSEPNDNFIPVTLEASEIDADNVFVDGASPGIISGYVFEDFNTNGMPDVTEGIQGISIKLFADANQDGAPDSGTPLASTTTSNIGFYTFGEVVNGDYVLTEVQPAGFNNHEDIDTSPDSDNVPNNSPTDDLLPVTISNGENDAHNYFKETSICNHVVTSLSDNAPGSLRYVLACSMPGDTIGFHPGLAGQSIHLNSDRLIIDKNIHILSNIEPRIHIHSNVSGAIVINPGITVEIKNLNFTSGLSGPPGAAFENYGSLTLWDVNITKNSFLQPGNYLLYNSGTGLITSKGNIIIEE